MTATRLIETRSWRDVRLWHGLITARTGGLIAGLRQVDDACPAMDRGREIDALGEALLADIEAQERAYRRTIGAGGLIEIPALWLDTYWRPAGRTA